jgi:hypothetical protein
MAVRWSFLLGAAFVATIAAACGKDVLLGGDGPDSGSGSTGGASGPCDGRRCGAQCAVQECSPALDGSRTCTVALGFCSLEGECAPDFPVCFLPCDPETAQCGDTCSPCDPLAENCKPPEQLYTCSADLSCVPGIVFCSCEANGTCPKFPCEDQPCGTPCECDPSLDPECYPSTGQMFCDGFGTCLPVEVVACPEGYAPCENKACGEACSFCAPNNERCFADHLPLACNEFGQCTDLGVSCYAPCSQGSCGEPCEPCDPANPDCVNPPSAFCDQFGSCVAGGAASYCPCLDLTCGAACTICDPEDPGCVEPPPGTRTCNDSGECSASTVCGS